MTDVTANRKWVGIWGNAMSVTERTAATHGKDITFRYPVPVPFDGDAVRLTLQLLRHGGRNADLRLRRPRRG